MRGRAETVLTALKSDSSSLAFASDELLSDGAFIKGSCNPNQNLSAKPNLNLSPHPNLNLSPHPNLDGIDDKIGMQFAFQLSEGRPVIF